MGGLCPIVQLDDNGVKVLLVPSRFGGGGGGGGGVGGGAARTGV